MPPVGGIFTKLFLLLGLLALLIGNAAAGLAGGLARSLALAAAAGLGALAEVAGLQSLDMLHWFSLPDLLGVMVYYTVFHEGCQYET